MVVITKSFSHYIIFMLTCSLVLNFAMSEVYTVGDENRWTDSYDYNEWVQKYTFHVDDVLVFSYTKEKHNVYDVDQTTYRSCDPSTGVIANYSTGNDKITLTEAKNYWFICTIDEHCIGGMRFGINVTKVDATSTSQSNTTTNTTSDSNTSSLPISVSISHIVGIYLLGVVIFMIVR